jgi:epoxyqueuosine reductase
MSHAVELTQTIKAMAIDAGFDRVGITTAALGTTSVGAAAAPAAAAFHRWLAMGWHADMAYLAANLDKRLDPTKLIAGAKSVICLAVSHERVTDVSPAGPRVADVPSARQAARTGARTGARTASVARFAKGPDYHTVLKKRCIQLMDAIRRIAPDFAGRAFCDSAPVMERTLAAAAGIGWIGRNGCLIVPGMGSYVVLAEIICNLPLASDHPIAPQCRQCRLCLSACPTGALAEIENAPDAGATAAPFAAVPGAMPAPAAAGAGMSPDPVEGNTAHSISLIDCRKCISYLTIEHHGQIPPELRPAMGQSIFGCDRCQQICPHNSGTHSGMGVPPVCPSVADVPSARQAGVSPARILQWTPRDWDIATRGTTIRRASYQMLLRNAIIAAGNSGDAALIEPLERLAKREPQLAELSQWAIDRCRASAYKDR